MCTKKIRRSISVRLVYFLTVILSVLSVFVSMPSPANECENLEDLAREAQDNWSRRAFSEGIRMTPNNTRKLADVNKRLKQRPHHPDAHHIYDHHDRKIGQLLSWETDKNGKELVAVIKRGNKTERIPARLLKTRGLRYKSNQLKDLENRALAARRRADEARTSSASAAEAPPVAPSAPEHAGIFEKEYVDYVKNLRSSDEKTIPHLKTIQKAVDTTINKGNGITFRTSSGSNYTGFIKHIEADGDGHALLLDTGESIKKINLKHIVGDIQINHARGVADEQITRSLAGLHKGDNIVVSTRTNPYEGSYDGIRVNADGSMSITIRVPQSNGIKKPLRIPLEALNKIENL